MEQVGVVNPSDDVWDEDGPPERRRPDLDKEIGRAEYDLWEGHDQRALLRIEYVARELRKRLDD